MPAPPGSAGSTANSSPDGKPRAEADPPRGGQGAASRLEEHLQSRAASRCARLRRYRGERAARRRRHPRHARRPVQAGGSILKAARPGRGRPVPGKKSRAVPRQCRHRVAAAHRRAGDERRRIPPFGRAADARAPDWRSRERAARDRGRCRIRRPGRLSAARSASRGHQAEWTGDGERRRVVAVSHGAADGPAASRFEIEDRGAGRIDFQALRGNHPERDAPFRRWGGAQGMALVRGPGGALRLSGKDLRRRRRLVRVVLSRRRRDRRRPGARRGRRARQHPGRRALHRGSRAHGGAGIDGGRLDRSCRGKEAQSGRHGSEPHSRCRDDRGSDGAVRRRPEHAAQYRQLAGEGNRPARSDGDGASQAGSARGGGKGFPADFPGEVEGRGDRYLRRPPHGDELFARRAGRRAGAHQRPGLRGQDLPGVFQRLRQHRGHMTAAPVIAIDGPSASGKGTIAKRVADELSFHYLESGALYRLIALVSLRDRLTDADALAEVAGQMAVGWVGEKILLSDQDVTLDVRTEEVSKRASEVAKIPEVRKRLLKRQRAFRRPPGLVADGRDMGTVVFPDATLKVFLTASPEVRAKRRYKQLIDKGIPANLRSLSRDLAERDARDRNRTVAPLVPAPDSQVLDSSALSIDAVAELIVRWYRERTGGLR